VEKSDWAGLEKLCTRDPGVLRLTNAGTGGAV